MLVDEFRSRLGLQPIVAKYRYHGEVLVATDGHGTSDRMAAL